MKVQQKPTQAQYHPTARNQVLANADVRLFQTQVVDKTGKIRGVFVWQCGSDIFYASTMEGMFDEARRHPAPAWLVTGIEQLPPDRRFNFDGTPKGEVEEVKPYLPTEEDAPAFVQG